MAERNDVIKHVFLLNLYGMCSSNYFEIEWCEKQTHQKKNDNRRAAVVQADGPGKFNFYLEENGPTGRLW